MQMPLFWEAFGSWQAELVMLPTDRSPSGRAGRLEEQTSCGIRETVTLRQEFKCGLGPRPSNVPAGVVTICLWWDRPPVRDVP